EILETNRFTLLENCLHYQEGGEWKASEDVIEITPEGAVAKRGPNKCTFSHDLNSEAVFEIQSSDGQRIRGGIRGIQRHCKKAGPGPFAASKSNTLPGRV